MQTTEFKKQGTYPVLDQSQDPIAGWTDDESALVKLTKPVVIFGDHTLVVKYSDRLFAQGADGIKIMKTNEELLPKFFYYFLLSEPIKSDGYKRHFSELRRIKIPLPDLATQKKFVAEMEDQEAIIESNKKLIEIMQKKIEEVLSEI